VKAETALVGYKESLSVDWRRFLSYCDRAAVTKTQVISTSQIQG
jgi:hypothetical protein